MKSIAGLRVCLALTLCGALAWSWRTPPVMLVRGPYLQGTDETSLTLVCQTDASVGAHLAWGPRAGPPWEFEQETRAGTTHVFRLEGLRPETRYVYELSAGGSVVASGEDCSFRTSPPEESRAPFRFFAWGDSGTGDRAQTEVAARMDLVLPQPAFTLGLGDLVYENGEWENYDPRLFRPYAKLFRHSTFWPALGNHDVKTESGAPYFDAFYLPTTTGAPNHPSNTEHYYSFDHGMAHFTCVDSEATSTNPGGSMYTWIDDDLTDARARGKRWLFVYMHHPPYSRGTHDSTTDAKLMDVHDDLVPLFEAHGVDMVMAGHSHVYERSYLARNDRILQNDIGDYTKIGSPDGTIYMVTGCGGRTGTGPLDHPLMARSYGNVAGFNVLDVSWDEIRVSFQERDGATTDLFRVRKARDVTPPGLALLRATTAGEIEAVFDEPVQAGTTQAGAENAANYSLDPAVPVLFARLDSDMRSVRLTTGSIQPDRSYELHVQRVADLDGNVADLRARFVRGGDAGGSGGLSAVVPRGASWRYQKGSSPPGAGWAAPDFADAAWSTGNAGFGYGDGDDATVLSDMAGNYACVYLRIAFDVADAGLVDRLRLSIDYDDGFVAYLNGSEVARSNVPLNQNSSTLAVANHEAGSFETFDLTAVRGALRTGRNVLAVEGHNVTLGSSDFSLHPELLLGLAGGAGGAPLAVIDATVHTATAPARLHFSAQRSQAAAPAAYSWDFGDGSASTSGSVADHLFDRAGMFPVTLVVTDGGGLQALDRLIVRITDQGSNPIAAFAASATSAQAGEALSFTSGGSMDPDGGTIFRDWDFGDPASGAANRSSLEGPSHAFAAPGSYTVTLTVVDDEGSSSSQSLPITIGGGGGGTPPMARFAVQTTSDPLERVFADTSTGDVTSRSWSFGDGGSSTLMAPTHRYAAAGRYTVTLTVSGPDGSDQETQTLDIDAGGGSGAGSGDSGTSGGGACSMSRGGRGGGGDPSLGLSLALVLALVAWRARPVPRAGTGAL